VTPETPREPREPRDHVISNERLEALRLRQRHGGLTVTRRLKYDGGADTMPTGPQDEKDEGNPLLCSLLTLFWEGGFKVNH